MSEKLKVHLGLFLVTAIYGGTYTVAKVLMPHLISSEAFIVLRIFFAGVALWIIHALFIKEKVESIRDIFYIAFCSMFGIAINMSLFFKGLSLTHPISASIMMITAPIFVVMFARLIYKEAISTRKTIGIVIGLTGAFFMIAEKGLNFSGDQSLGNLLIIVNALSYALYLVIVRPVLKKYNPLTVVKWAFLFGFIVVLPLGYNDLVGIEWVQFGATQWWAFIFVVFGTTFLAYLINAWALKKVSSGIVGAYIFLQPVLASFIAILAQSDTLTLRKVLFSLLVFIGIYLVSIDRASGLKIYTFLKGNRE